MTHLVVYILQWLPDCILAVRSLTESIPAEVVLLPVASGLPVVEGVESGVEYHKQQALNMEEVEVVTQKHHQLCT